MGNEMQAMTPFDSFGDQSSELGFVQPGGGGGADGPRPKGLVSACHRALRGRYKFALPLAFAGASIGAFFGWRSQKPLYKSEGAVMIQYQSDSIFLRESKISGTIPLYEEFLQTQTLVMTSRNTVNAALQETKWQDTKRGDDAVAAKSFADSLIVEHPRQTQAIHVSFIDTDPGVAAAGVESIINAYQKVYTAVGKKTDQTNLQLLNDRITSLKQKSNAERNNIKNIGDEYGTEDLTAILQNKVVTFNKLDAELDQAKISLAKREGKGDPAKIIDDLTPEKIGMLDTTNVMARKLEARQLAQNDLNRLKATLGDRNPRVVEAARVLEAAREDVDNYAREYKDLNKQMVQAGAGSRGPLFDKLNDTIDSLKKDIANLTDLRNKAAEEMKNIGNKQREIDAHRETIKALADEIKGFEQARAAIDDEARGDGRLKIISKGDVPMVPFKDRRKAMAVAGAMGSGGLPILLFLALGFLDKRFRYSDEADGGNGMPPLLGILPTLPDRLSDPEQAAIAAHCIHQLRIMLQVNGGPDRKVFMITSASAGDGKTSLTMALGLSFAASGSRTLVMDCDMVGQGLTARLKARNSPGLLEALGAGTLNQRVKKTTTQNLFILPIGGADSAHAGSLSPASIRKLLHESRRVFDVVIIDTGPILGSLEAAVVGAAADAVVLTISRGQQQPLVERSVRQLRQIGANIAGLVFNRAEKRDFERSVGSSSIRSMSQQPVPQRLLIGEGADESRFGPLARSVASFMPSATAGGRELPPATGAAAAATSQPQQPHGDPLKPHEIRVEVVSRSEVTNVAADDTAVGIAHGQGDGR